MKKLKKGDKILIVSTLLFSILSLFYIKEKAKIYDKKYVSIQINGREEKKIFLGREVIGKTIPIKSKYGYNLVEIGKDKVRIIDADCPDKLDVKRGWIKEAGETIVCLPNRLIVEIKGIEEKEIDYLSK